MSFSSRLTEAVRVRSKNRVTLAGLDPSFTPSWVGPTVFEWWEGGHMRAVEVREILKDESDHVVFITMDGDVFRVEPLTLELYEKEVRPHTVGRPEFKTRADMIMAMRLEW